MIERRRLAVAIIAIQVAIPLALLVHRGDDARPRAFGWQMFTDHGGRTAATLIDVDGGRTPVDVDALLLRPRAELQLGDTLAAYLCEQEITAVAVEIEVGLEERTVRC